MEIRADSDLFARDLSGVVDRALERSARLTGLSMQGQIQRRFDNGGDEEVTWPPLWVDSLQASQASSGRSQRAVKEENLARRQLKRATPERRGRAEERLRYALGGFPVPHRAGGTPLSDRGILRASIVHTVETKPGEATLRIGTPLKYGRWQQEGFEAKGKLFVPISAKAQAGWNPSLVAGYDYLMVRKIKVPARPWLRITADNKAEIKANMRFAFGGSNGS